MSNIFNLHNKVVLITGAFGLFGKQISNSFLQHGAKVILAGHNKNSISDIEKELSKKYPASDFLVTSVELKNSKTINDCVTKCLEKFGKIDVLVNNASIDAKFDEENKTNLDMNRFENYPMHLVEESVEVNLLGTIRITQSVCKEMVKQKSGNIINVGSIYSVISPNQQLYDFGDDKINYKPVDYIASKSFIPNFTRYLASLYAQENIRCNAIAPHGVYNNHDEAFLKNFMKFSPIGRMCNLDELDGPFIFLASDASSYITGITLIVDGGWTSI